MLRQESCEFELLSLFWRKAGTFVEVWRVEESGAGQRAVLGTRGAEGEMTEVGVLFVRFGEFVVGGHFGGTRRMCGWADGWIG